MYNTTQKQTHNHYSQKSDNPDPLTGKEYHLLLNAIKDHAVFMIDTDGHIITWNEGAEILKGYTEEEIKGQHFRLLFLPEDRDKKLPELEMQEALEKGKSESDWWRMKKDGSRFWAHIVLTPVYEEDGKHVGFAKLTSDRTVQKRSDELINFLMNEVADYAIFLIDKAGKITSWSNSAQATIGYKQEEIMDKSFSILHTEEDIRAGVPDKELADAIENGKLEGEGWRVRNDGTLFWSSFVITPLHDDTGYVAMMRDLTDKKELEQITKSNAILDASNKELERFAYIASHDLKEPIRKMLLYSSMLTAETEQQKEKIRKIVEFSEHMRTLIDNVFQYSTITKPKPFERISLNDILKKVLSSMSAVLKEKKVVVRHDILPEAPVVPAQMEQLFLGLISNAVKFCCNHGNVPEVDITHQVVLKENMQASQLEALRPSDSYLVIKFKDNGIGFEQRYAANIFDLFRRLHGKAHYEGTGLGLSICKKVAENHGGTITAASEPDKGAEFTVIIPM